MCENILKQRHRNFIIYLKGGFMKKVLTIFILMGGCGIYLMNSRTERLKEDAIESDAALPSKEIFGSEFHLFAMERNVMLNLTGNLGYSHSCDKKIYGNYEVGVETRFTHAQGFLELGVIPFPKRPLIFYPYFGIGGGLISADIQGISRTIHIDYGYPAFEIGSELLIPLEKKFWKKNFYTGLYLRGGYIFSFYEFFNGPYLSFGYSLNIPPEGIIASIIGGIIVIGGGR